ncbi:hypothetical protein D0Z00_001585 [Geotrichum galactomycetum]|uniref:Uncharacterized protein n=1 Tax=Geotrichum galactomycetum TaxID=27317 RepID=A0ACB6V6H7_9ASCO|nr:hypothetical protein D0Z00_001585 [Geotrichum candidum]
MVHIRQQLANFLERGRAYAETHGYANGLGTATTRNNHDWWKDVNMLRFLATYGRHIRVGQMLARDSVKNRMESEQGIGFNEFTYQILQAYDFWHLHSQEGCSLQVGGNDQWGNITAGIDLISRMRAEYTRTGRTAEIPKLAEGADAAYGITVPLLTTPSGEKFGKSAGNAVWINADLTKPYELYQYFVRAPDSVVENYLKMFTLLPLEHIDAAVEEHRKDESRRTAQKLLAEEITDLVHGLGAGNRAKIMSAVMFPSAAEGETLAAAEVLQVFRAENMLVSLKKDEVVGAQWRDVIAGLTKKSKCKCERD